MALKLCSININGLRQGFKQKIVFTRLNSFGFDIVFLQETHVHCMGEASKFSKLWEGKYFWSFGTTRSCGVAILLNKQLCFKVISENWDTDGRLLCLDINMADCKFRLINVYMPNNDVTRKDFINDLEGYLITPREIILGGDFNFVEDISLDKMGGNLDRGNSGAVNMGLLKSDFYLVDAFRRKFPKRKEYSHRQGPIHIRLDRFYISDTLLKWVDKIQHTPCSVSDHYFVDVYFKEFDLENFKYGPGYWMCNTNVLSDPQFVSDLEDLWYNTLAVSNVKDGVWWENCKLKFKKLIIRHSRKISVKLKKQIKDAEASLRQYITLSHGARNPTHFQGYVNQIKSYLNDLISQKLQGSIVRSRVQILEEYEKPTRHFLRIEKRNAKAKMISEIREGNNIFTNPNDIMKCCRDFYLDLYSEEPIDIDMVDRFLHNVNLPRLPPDIVEHCEGILSFEEVKEAISFMKNGKTPGSDGLPAEFYKKFFHLFGRDFIAMINFCYFFGKLTPSQRQCLITLLCKDRDFHYLLKFWRPISLLNVDYKIVSKSLSLRLRKALPFIVKQDQTCSVPGRSISDNVHLFRNIFDFVEQKELRCAFLNLDQAKAFDRVSTNYLLRVLSSFGFGPMFISWIKLLYTDISSCVIVNGHIGLEFPVRRSVRQGCAISPLLYVLSMEPFAHRIRREPGFCGLQMPGTPKEVRVSLYADDTTLVVTDVNSIPLTFSICREFGLASGAKLNMDKTCGIWLGRWKDGEDSPYGIKWVKSKKLLGVHFGYGDMFSDNWSPVMEEFIQTLGAHSMRNLSMTGRAVISNVMAIPKLTYIGQFLHLPEQFLKLINKELFSFIYAEKHECIKRETLYGDPSLGGIGLVCIKLKLRAFLIMHIVRLLTYSGEYMPKWVEFAIYWIGLHYRAYNPQWSPKSTSDRPRRVT